MAVRAVKKKKNRKLQHKKFELQVKLLREWHDGIFLPKSTLFEDQSLIICVNMYVTVCY